MQPNDSLNLVDSTLTLSIQKPLFMATGFMIIATELQHSRVSELLFKAGDASYNLLAE